MAEMNRDCQQVRVLNTREWLATHKPHGSPQRLANEHQPPAGTYMIYTLHCPCGAKHVISVSARKDERL